AIGIAATIAVSASAADQPAGPGNLATTQLVMYVSRGGPGDPLPMLSASQLDAARASVAQVAGRLHAFALPLDQAYHPNTTPVSLNPAGTGRIVVSPGSVGGQSAGYLSPVLASVARTAHGEDI